MVNRERRIIVEEREGVACSPSLDDEESRASPCIGRTVQGFATVMLDVPLIQLDKKGDQVKENQVNKLNAYYTTLRSASLRIPCVEGSILF
jgi:hypothetical protein